MAALGRVLLFWVGYIVILWFGSQPKLMVPEQWGQLTWGLASSLLLIPLTWLFLRWDKRVLADVGMAFSGTSIPRVLVGTLIGLAVFGLVILAIVLAAGPGAVQFELYEGWKLGSLLGILAMTFALSCMEEIGFRGYPLRTLVDSMGLWPAQALVAVAFALSHIAYGWAWPTVLLGVLPAGLLFGMSATASGGLAMPIGVHAGVNLAQRLIGENDAGDAAIWTLVVQEGAQSRVAMVSPIISVAFVLLATGAFWYWHRVQQTGDGR